MPYRAPLRDHRRGEPAERLRDEHDVATVADRGLDGVGVLGQAERRVVLADVDRDRRVAARLELGHELGPVGRVAARARDEHERGRVTHAAILAYAGGVGLR